MLKLFGTGDRLYVQAQRIWLILAAHAVFKPDTSDWGAGYITYGDLAEIMGKSRQAGRTLSKQLGIVGYYCLDNKIPALNSIVVNQDTGYPGEDVVLTASQKLEREQRKVLHYDWFSIRPPTIRALRMVYEEHNWR